MVEKNILTTLVERQTAKYGNATALYSRIDGKWEPKSWTSLSEDVNRAACALEILGLAEGDRLAVF